MRADWAAPLADLLARMPRDGWRIINYSIRRATSGLEDAHCVGSKYWEECPISSTCGYASWDYREAMSARGYPIAFVLAVVEASDSRRGAPTGLRQIILDHLNLTEVSP